MDWQAIGLTLRLAAITTILLVLFALPLAHWIASGRSTLRSFLQAIVTLPLVLPPTVLGFYLLVELGPLTRLGSVVISILGHPLAFSFSGLVIGSMLYSLPFAVQPMIAGFRAVDARFPEAASTLGASPRKVFRTVTLPLARGSVAAAAVLCFTHTVGEFGVVLMLGGNIPGSTRTMSIVLYDQVQDGRYRDANRTALFLLLTALIGLVALYWQQGRARPLQTRPVGTIA